jgi:hypothetical protein
VFDRELTYRSDWLAAAKANIPPQAREKIEHHQRAQLSHGGPQGHAQLLGLSSFDAAAAVITRNDAVGCVAAQMRKRDVSQIPEERSVAVQPTDLVLNREVLDTLDRLAAVKAAIFVEFSHQVEQNQLLQAVRSRADRHAELLGFLLIANAHISGAVRRYVSSRRSRDCRARNNCGGRDPAVQPVK